MTKRRRIIAVLIVVIFVGGLVAVVWPREREPVYQGKKLSVWLALQDDRPVEAANAIGEIGTNGLPFLVKWVAYETPAWRGRAARLIANSPAWTGSKSVRPWLLGNEGYSLARRAKFGFRVLGERAGPAASELGRIIMDPRTKNPMFAADALAWVGRDGVAPLVAALEVKGQSPTRRSEIIRAIGIVQYRGPELRQTIPILISSLQDSDEFVAGLAASALGAFVIEPEKCIPALTKAAESPAYRVRRNAIRSLGEFGPQAGGASNVIANGLNDSEANVRKEATNALRKIAPEGLGTNGVDHW